MTRAKKDILKKAMGDFDKYKGGTNVDPKESSIDSSSLQVDLQNSFDHIFPELIKKEKHRKHVIFDDDVFRMYESICKSSGAGFSSLINSALRNFAKEKFNSSSNDPVSELLSLRNRERELLKEIKELDLVEELNSRL
ncbi:hypothetical protein A9Q84_09480 [Halobacteriovorax marinus]|uniref:Uncharacterized protein n=1 Tax=Halobacteriovorax marinus TaxID=97084 RepID=A0A1Y5FCJ2_9BACT|nr:hypothetical protein A9Q84_09480 [Halobacteriovorax marinus]